tara:strand:+ start:549 stop:1154 length:606 start_codon:yes stop_codon:yes gene_type:complete
MFTVLNIFLFVTQVFLRKKYDSEIEEYFENIVCFIIYPSVACFSYIELYKLEDRILSRTPITETLIYFMLLRLSLHFLLCRKIEYKIHHLSFGICLAYIFITERFHYYAILSFLMEFTHVPLIMYYKTKLVFWGILLWIFFIIFRLSVACNALFYHFEDSNRKTFMENILSKTILVIMFILNFYWFALITKKIILKLSKSS